MPALICCWGYFTWMLRESVLHDRLLGGMQDTCLFTQKGNPSQSKATITHLLIMANRWGFTGIATRSTNERLFTRSRDDSKQKQLDHQKAPSTNMCEGAQVTGEHLELSLSSLQAAHFLCGSAGRPFPPDSCLLLLDIAGKALSRIFWVSVPPDMWLFVYPLKLPSFSFAPWAGGWCFNLECCNPEKNSAQEADVELLQYQLRNRLLENTNKDLSRGENTKGN